MSDLDLAVFGVDHVRPLDGVVGRVDPVNVLVSRVKVDGLHAFFVDHDADLVALLHVETADFRTAGEKNYGFVFDRATHSTEIVRQSETIATRAHVTSVQIGANLGTMVQALGALVHVFAVLAIVQSDDVARVASADVATVRHVLAVMRATTFVRVGAVLVVV